MALFRREKDSVDEYRRAREALMQPAPGVEASPPPPPVTGWKPEGERSATVAPQEAARPVEPAPDPSPPDAAHVSDPFEVYRKGATTVGKDTSFKGTLQSDGNLFIEGNFDGELEANATVVIAAGAQVKANVRATDVIVAGTLDGAVDARDRFHAMPSARVSGQINSTILVVDQGSEINCRFSMKSNGEAGAS